MLHTVSAIMTCSTTAIIFGDGLLSPKAFIC